MLCGGLRSSGLDILGLEGYRRLGDNDDPMRIAWPFIGPACDKCQSFVLSRLDPLGISQSCGLRHACFSEDILLSHGIEVGCVFDIQCDLVSRDQIHDIAKDFARDIVMARDDYIPPLARQGRVLVPASRILGYVPLGHHGAVLVYLFPSHWHHLAVQLDS